MSFLRPTREIKRYRDVRAAEPSDLSSGATDTATEIQHLVSRLQTHHECQVVLVSGERGRKAFGGETRRKVERVTPAILVEIYTTERRHRELRHL
jgi:hypothetical protein